MNLDILDTDVRLHTQYRFRTKSEVHVESERIFLSELDSVYMGARPWMRLNYDLPPLHCGM